MVSIIFLVITVTIRYELLVDLLPQNVDVDIRPISIRFFLQSKNTKLVYDDND